MSNSNDNSVYFSRLHSDAIIPFRATPSSAGFDLFSVEDVTISGGQGNVLVSTGIALALPPGTYGRIAMRSGLAVREHLSVSAGVIDSDYRGEVKVVVYTTKANHTYKISKGEKFAQLVVEKINLHPGTCVNELPKVYQEHLGFGSTGKFVPS
jgi:dUTP pyrophosphatase